MARTAYFNTLSIIDILPNDIMQHIESFTSDVNLVVINKKWSEYHHNNYHRLRKQAINSVPFQPNIGISNSSNSSWNVFPDHVIQQGCPDPMDGVDSIEDVLSKCKSGDTLRIHPGVYDIGLLDVERDVRFIGVGHGVIFISETSKQEDNSTVTLLNNTNASFENIIFDLPTAYCGTMSLNPGSKMWLKNCSITCGQVGVMVMKDACLHVKQCRFHDGSVAISVSPRAGALTVVNSKFTTCGQEQDPQVVNYASYSCIDVWDEYGDMYPAADSSATLLNVQCIGNVFQKNLCLPIAEHHEVDSDSDEECFLINTKSFEAKYNRIYNQFQIKSNVRPPLGPLDCINPNRIYYNIRKLKLFNVSQFWSFNHDSITDLNMSNTKMV
eukprot:1035689_1